MAVVTRKRLLLLLVAAVGAWFARSRKAPITTAPPNPPRPPAERPAPTEAAPLPDGGSPGPAFTIKGNGSSMLFHTEDSPYFARTKAERWFASEDAARAAGFRRWNERPFPAAVVPDGRYGPGSADPRANGASPGPAFGIKGDEDSMLFHTKDSPSFARTRAAQWFSSEEAARAAGFRRWDDPEE